MAHELGVQAAKYPDDIFLLSAVIKPKSSRSKHHYDGGLHHVGVHLSAQAAVTGTSVATQEHERCNNEKPGLMAYIESLTAALAPAFYKDVDHEWVKVEHRPSGRAASVQRAAWPPVVGAQFQDDVGRSC